jgi:formiminoglutamase
MRNFESPPRALFFKSPRPNDSRIGELVRPLGESNIGTTKPAFVLLGYPDDDGIRINYGRPGSREAPDAIRAAFYKLTPGRMDFPKVYDLGNLVLDGPLVERHEKAREAIKLLHESGHRTISLGGGHDYGYCDIAGFLDTVKKKRALVINFDSHLDVRPDNDGPNSGSAFYRVLEKYDNFDLVEIGIQPFCNSRNHRAYAVKKKVEIYNLSESYGRLLKIVSSLIKTRRPTFISIDIDAFSAAYAPGASASYASGLEANEFMSMLRLLAAKADVRGMGIYEVSPPLDIQNRTSQFAAVLAHTFLHAVDRNVADRNVVDKKSSKKSGKK